MDLLFAAYALVERFGAPLAAAAWCVAWGVTIGLAWALRHEVQRLRRAFLAMLTLSLCAHLLDIGVTLLITPDLAMEANPIWLIVLHALGFQLAVVYGVTGKVLVSVMSAYAYVYYLAYRDELLPAQGSSPLDFIRSFGSTSPRRFGVRWAPILHLFAFLFAWIGPFFFYIVALNSVGALSDDMRLYDALPGPFVAVTAYLLGMVALYFAIGFRRLQQRA